jgi:adenosylcobinamide kinase / adenosylcobinamide-phosphate guanylyltransferase
MALTLLLGGARSGKSALGVRLARTHPGPVLFIATMRISADEELEERISRHREERPSGWLTVEEPVSLDRVLREAPDDACVIIDCLSLWAANVLADGQWPQDVEGAARLHAALAAARRSSTIAVSNEVGMGVHPMTPVGRRYRDVLGRVNSIWAEVAERAWLVSAGRVFPLQAADAVIRELR